MGIRIFISYTRKDEEFKNKLISHMSGLVRNGAIENWHDREILPGQEWDIKVKNEIDKSKIIIFLISSDFMNSDYIYDVEIDRAIRKYEKGEVVIVPIIVRPCDYGSLKLSKFQTLPKDALPISVWENEDYAYLNIINELKKLIPIAEKLFTNNVLQPKFLIEESLNDAIANNDKEREEALGYMLSLNFTQLWLNALKYDSFTNNFSNTFVSELRKSTNENKNIHSWIFESFKIFIGEIMNINFPNHKAILLLKLVSDTTDLFASIRVVSFRTLCYLIEKHDLEGDEYVPNAFLTDEIDFFNEFMLDSFFKHENKDNSIPILWQHSSSIVRKYLISLFKEYSETFEEEINLKNLDDLVEVKDKTIILAVFNKIRNEFSAFDNYATIWNQLLNEENAFNGDISPVVKMVVEKSQVKNSKENSEDDVNEEEEKFRVDVYELFMFPEYIERIKDLQGEKFLFDLLLSVVAHDKINELVSVFAFLKLLNNFSIHSISLGDGIPSILFKVKESSVFQNSIIDSICQMLTVEGMDTAGMAGAIIGIEKIISILDSKEIDYREKLIVILSKYKKDSKMISLILKYFNGSISEDLFFEEFSKSYTIYE